MPDITMCKGGECPLRSLCYRFTAMPGEHQSWFMTPPYSADDDSGRVDCMYFYPNDLIKP